MVFKIDKASVILALMIISIIGKTTALPLDGISYLDKSSDGDRNEVNKASDVSEIVPRYSDEELYWRMLADDMGIVEPTARIKVTVIKRSRRYWEPWELNYNVCPPSLCTANEENRPRGTGGTVFYNGDIVLDNESEKIIYGNSIRLRYKRATMRSSRTWRNATVPYMFASDIAAKSKSVLRKAMKEIEKETCVRFRRRKLRDEDYIRFISEPGCWSGVGRVGGEQKVSIGPGCERTGIAIHEISHSLGFWHEQARPDRDEYVKIIEENISPRYLPDFNKANKTLVSSRGFPYDYESVMHYSKKAFTNVGEDTIKVIGIGKKLKMKIGQRDGLSNLDIAQLRDMYKCNDKEDNLVAECPKDWIKIGRKCYKFEDKAPEQFGGAAKRCSEMNSKLLFIEDEAEDKAIKRYVKRKYSDIKVWRTGGRVVNGTFVWYTDDKNHEEMKYTHWKKGHPGSFSSMALVYNKKKDRVRWEGVWLGSYTQMPEHAYPFICERRARRKCIPGNYSDGREYRGTLDHTIDGYTCQKWSSQYPWKHSLLSYPYNEVESNKDGLGDHNYCRNPSGDRKSRPWCYTTKSKYKWQYCDVSVCKRKDSAPIRENNNRTKPSRKPRRSNSTNQRRNTNKKDSESKNEREKEQNDGPNQNDKNSRRNHSGKNSRKDQNRRNPRSGQNGKNSRTNQNDKNSRTDQNDKKSRRSQSSLNRNKNGQKDNDQTKRDKDTSNTRLNNSRENNDRKRNNNKSERRLHSRRNNSKNSRRKL